MFLVEQNLWIVITKSVKQINKNIYFSNYVFVPFRTFLLNTSFFFNNKTKITDGHKYLHKYSCICILKFSLFVREQIFIFNKKITQNFDKWENDK